MAFIQIDDPDKPGDYLVIASDAFDPLLHRRFGAAESASAAPMAATEVVTLIKAAETLGELAALGAQEARHPSGARASVLKALDIRRAQLAPE